MYTLAFLESADIDFTNIYAIYIDIKRLLETSVPESLIITENGIFAYDDMCKVFDVCSVGIIIDDITSSVEPNFNYARLHPRPDRPVWFISKFENDRERLAESIYDGTLAPRLLLNLRHFMIPVFVGMVVGYLIRKNPE